MSTFGEKGRGPKSEEGGSASVKLVIAVAKGILGDTRARRSVLFVIVLADLLIVFLGAVPLNAWLLERPLVFIAYWLVCAWLTLTSFLLAVFDLLMLRRTARRATKDLKAKVLGFPEKTPDSDP